MDKKNEHKSKIGGQALIEGIMMRGVHKGSMAVRLSNGEIEVEEWDITPKKTKIFTQIPIIRGIFNFIASMKTGYECLSKSAQKAELDLEGEETSKFEDWLLKVCGDKLMGIVAVVGTVLGVILAIGLFMLLPILIVKAIDLLIPLGGFKTIIEGVIKITLFIVYLWLVSLLPDIKRVFEYHGAEHKTIACFEAGDPLTVENVRKYTRFHPRCGTSFLIIILILSIIVFSFVGWGSTLMRMVIKIALLPLVLGIAYEIIKIAGRYDNIVTRFISFPGISLQHLTTNEPDDTQIEVAIAAILPVIPKDLEEDKW